MRVRIGTSWLLTIALAVMAILSMPDSAEAHEATSIHAEERSSVADASLIEHANSSIIHGHCHPGLDCLSVALFIHISPLREAHAATTTRRVCIERSDLRSRIVPFDLPPPRFRS